MADKGKILIVDDISINRVILKKILRDEYEILEASNGKEALDVLRKIGTGISLVLLDLVMPVMDGYEVLAQVKNDMELSTIPIIVITGSVDGDNEARCLKEGATDFVSKPFNVEVVRNRVRSMIRLRENSRLLQQIKNDALTGIYTREFFCQKARDIIDANPDKKFDIVCSDIVNFKLVNERYGRKMGDDLLKAVADELKRHVTNEHTLVGRIASNTFAVFCEHRESYTNEIFVKETSQALKKIPLKSVVVKYGIYVIDDRGMPVMGMCDRAMLAMRTIKQKYGYYFAYYDDKIRIRLLEEERVSEQMVKALDNKEFVVFLQPKHDVKTGSVAGAEALVRWQHPSMGIIPPGVFIPVFERNGFISKVDAFVWEDTCRLLRKWLDEGIDVVPISVNISRVDFDVLPLKEHFLNLVHKYNLPPELLHLEVTESAYMENPEEMIDVVDTLRQQGFIIEMDDFGSGYSSLNLLSDLPIDILKIDMKFVSDHKNAANNQGILSFILNLSKWLGLPTIVEGVETSEDLHLLIDMGCDFVQGYYFSKPMPSGEFATYLKEYNDKKDEHRGKDNPEEVENKDKEHSVLLVEDNPLSMNILRNMLSPYYDILEATNGSDAVDVLREHCPNVDVVLLDLMMPIMDGFQLINLIRRDEQLKDLPLVVISDADKENEVKALKLGADNFIPKPYNLDILQHHLNKAIERHELLKQHKEL